MVGQVVGKYRVLDRVGRGGMGTVYRAIDETLHREVAIKVLNAELNDPEVARRFRAEAITVARLSHPGIATIYELFQHDGQWLMVMEFLRGETLESVIATRGGLPPDRAAQLCMQCLTALAHAHSMGVVHRDLKPANLMVTDSGDTKIMDFGIARVAGTEHLTNVGFMMGTPAYMAPEQVLGHEIDARADLYAMGVVFYRLLTGHLPFKGDSPFAMAQAQVNGMPTPIGQLRQDLPTWVAPLIARALEKKPEDRFQSALDFHDAIERSLSADAGSATARSATSAGVGVPHPHIPGHRTPGYGSAGPAAAASSDPTMLATPHAGSGRIPSGTPASFDSAALTPTVAAATPVTVERPAVGSATPVEVAPAATPVSPQASGRGTRTVGLVAILLLAAVLGSVAWWWLASGDSTSPASGENPPVDEVVLADPDTSEPPLAPAPTDPLPATAPPAVASPLVVPPAGDAGPESTEGSSPEGSASDVPPSPPVEAAPPVEVTNVKVMIVDGRKADDEDVRLMFEADGLVVTGVRGGTTLATLPYRQVASATYVRARSPRWDPAFAAPPDDLDVGGMFRPSRHWLMLQGSGDYLLLRLEDINVIHTIREVEARTGLTVQRPN